MMRAVRFSLVWLFLTSTGCSYFQNLQSPDRLQNGYTLVLPGIETASFANSNIAQGLENGGVKTAIEVHDWTTGKFSLALYHLRNLDRNKLEAQKLADKIVAYQDRFPGKPVYLIGHSGGGGLTLLTLESLPPDRTITAAILLAPAVSPTYDLSTALSRTEAGIWNYHSSMDAILLIAGTTIAGTIDGKHTPAAGAFGFSLPEEIAPEKRVLYETKLRQVGYDLEMAAHGNLGGHFGSTWYQFSEDYLAPILLNPFFPGKSEPNDHDQAGFARIPPNSLTF
jgi:pimeloyl-ACP methyl ester carboxylesterase